MLLTRSMDPRWLSNSWLLADAEGGHGVLVDCGAPPEPLEAALVTWGVSLTAVLLTHHHPDHVVLFHQGGDRLVEKLRQLLLSWLALRLNADGCQDGEDNAAPDDLLHAITSLVRNFVGSMLTDDDPPSGQR